MEVLRVDQIKYDICIHECTKTKPIIMYYQYTLRKKKKTQKTTGM